MSNPHGIISNAICNVLMDTRAHSNVFLYNTYIVASQNNWHNDTMKKMTDTISLLLDMFATMPDCYPSDVVAPDDRLYYVVELACENTGALLIAKAPHVANQLDGYSRQRMEMLLQRINHISADIDRYTQTKQHTQRSSGRYTVAQPTLTIQHANDAVRGGRYVAASPTIIKEQPTFTESFEIPHVLRRNANMDYEFHKLSTELNPKARRVKPKPDFMGELANVQIAVAEEGSPVDLSRAFAITPANTPTATSLAHAKTLAMLDIATTGTDYGDHQVLEYGFNYLNTLKVFTDTQQMQLFAVSVPAISMLSRAETVTEVAEAISSLLSSNNKVAEAIGRRLNTMATKHTNDLVKFKLVLELNVDDFVNDIDDLIAEVKLACDDSGDPEMFDREWGYCSNSLLSCLRCVYIASEDPATVSVVNATFAANVADRSIFWLEPTYVAYWPVAFYDLQIDPNYGTLGQAFLTHAIHPELYKSVSDLVARARQANESGYCRIFVVTDDNVQFEVLYTEVSDDDGKYKLLLRQA